VQHYAPQESGGSGFGLPGQHGGGGAGAPITRNRHREARTGREAPCRREPGDAEPDTAPSSHRASHTSGASRGLDSGGPGHATSTDSAHS